MLFSLRAGLIKHYPVWNAPTVFDLVPEGNNTVLHVVSDRSAPSFAFAQHIDPDATPLIKWRVSKAVADSDLRTKNRDDYAARVHALFDLPVTG